MDAWFGDLEQQMRALQRQVATLQQRRSCGDADVGRLSRTALSPPKAVAADPPPQAATTPAPASAARGAAPTPSPSPPPPPRPLETPPARRPTRPRAASGRPATARPSAGRPTPTPQSAARRGSSSSPLPFDAEERLDARRRQRAKHREDFAKFVAERRGTPVRAAGKENEAKGNRGARRTPPSGAPASQGRRRRPRPTPSPAAAQATPASLDDRRKSRDEARRAMREKMRSDRQKHGAARGPGGGADAAGLRARLAGALGAATLEKASELVLDALDRRDDEGAQLAEDLEALLGLEGMAHVRSLARLVALEDEHGGDGG